MAEIVKNYESEYQKTSAYIKAEFNQLSITEARGTELTRWHETAMLNLR
jgi:hypothetical protein